MKTEPTIEQRPEQPYVGTRAIMAMDDFDRAIPAMTAKVFAWLQSNGPRPSGKPFLRYHVIDMPKRMDVELGIPVDSAPDAGGEVKNNVLPAGRYAVLTYVGVKNGVPANKKLVDWIAEHDEEMASHDSQEGEVFDARYETFLTDAKAEANQDKWDIEVAIELRE